MTRDLKQLRGALASLHRQKDAAYRDAWKKRGEVLGVLANVARKVDRLEYVTGTKALTQDETNLDTVVDLLIYCLKYQTYLADIDEEVASQLFGESAILAPFSDGTQAFEYLLEKAPIEPATWHPWPFSEAVQAVVNNFADLERCFLGLSDARSPLSRLSCSERLVATACQALVAVIEIDGQVYKAFLSQHS